MDVDIGKTPEPHHLSPTSEPASIPTLDGWIENLMNCKQLAENDVQRLCDRVRYTRHGGWLSSQADRMLMHRLERYCKTSPTSSQWYVP